MRSVHSDRMGCGIEPRKEEFCGGRDARNRRRQHVRHRYARCRRFAGVEGHITSERNASEPERSHVRPQAAEPTGPHREGEEPKPMMHGHEKSDSAIVAMKLPNKAGRPSAEAVERRVEAKENANRCRTCRTQCRESVSPTPERVRKAEASRQTSEVGAVCRKAARTVLCGGRPVMGVPTAIVRNLGMGRDPLLDVGLALLGYVVEWDKVGLPTAARSISGRAIVASSLILRRFLRDLEAVGRGEDPKAVIRDPKLNHSIRALANIDGSVRVRTKAGIATWSS